MSVPAKTQVAHEHILNPCKFDVASASVNLKLLLTVCRVPFSTRPLVYRCGRYLIPAVIVYAGVPSPPSHVVMHELVVILTVPNNC